MIYIVFDSPPDWLVSILEGPHLLFSLLLGDKFTIFWMLFQNVYEAISIMPYILLFDGDFHYAKITYRKLN